MNYKNHMIEETRLIFFTFLEKDLNVIFQEVYLTNNQLFIARPDKFSVLIQTKRFIYDTHKIVDFEGLLGTHYIRI